METDVESINLPLVARKTLKTGIIGTLRVMGRFALQKTVVRYSSNP